MTVFKTSITQSADFIDRLYIELIFVFMFFSTKITLLTELYLPQRGKILVENNFTPLILSLSLFHRDKLRSETLWKYFFSLTRMRLSGKGMIIKKSLKFLVSGFWLLVSGFYNFKPKTLNLKPKTLNLKPKTLNQKP